MKTVLFLFLITITVFYSTVKANEQQSPIELVTLIDIDGDDKLDSLFFWYCLEDNRRYINYAVTYCQDSIKHIILSMYQSEEDPGGPFFDDFFVIHDIDGNGLNDFIYSSCFDGGDLIKKVVILNFKDYIFEVFHGYINVEDANFSRDKNAFGRSDDSLFYWSDKLQSFISNEGVRQPTRKINRKVTHQRKSKLVTTLGSIISNDSNSIDSIVVDVNRDGILDTITFKCGYYIFKSKGENVILFNANKFREFKKELSFIKNDYYSLSYFVFSVYREGYSIGKYKTIQNIMIPCKDSIKIISPFLHSNSVRLEVDLSLSVFYDQYYKIATWDTLAQNFYSPKRWIIGDSIPLYVGFGESATFEGYFSGVELAYNKDEAFHGKTAGWRWIEPMNYLYTVESWKMIQAMRYEHTINGWVKEEYLSDYAPISYFKYEKF